MHTQFQEVVSLADKTDSVYGMICEIVRRETLYLRHYMGQVLSQTDERNIGIVQVSVPELGWTTGDIAPWCYPRQRHSMSVPEIGEWVEVYFLNGDRNRPVYIANCGELSKDDNKYCIPEWYTGDPKLRVIYQSPTSGKGIKLDDTQNIMTIDSENIVMIDGSTEPFVLGTQLENYLKNLVDTELNAHTHQYVDTPVGPSMTNPPSKAMTAPTGILSTKIKGQ